MCISCLVAIVQALLSLVSDGRVFVLRYDYDLLVPDVINSCWKPYSESTSDQRCLPL